MALRHLHAVWINGNDPEARVITAACLAALSGYAIIAAVSFPTYRSVPPFLLALYLGMLFAVPIGSGADEKSEKKRKYTLTGKGLLTAMSATAALVLCAGGYTQYRWIVADIFYQRQLNASQADQWKQSLLIEEKAETMNPFRHEIRLNRAASFISLGRFEDARSLLQSYLEAFPFNISGLYNLALTHMHLTEWAKAVSLLERLRGILPHVGKVHFELASGYAAMGQKFEALESYKVAARLESTRPHFQFRYGEYAYEIARFKEAIEGYEKGLVLDHKNLTATNNLARICEMFGRKKDARRHYRRVLELDADHADAHLRLVRLIEEAGNDEEALHHCGEVVRVEPQNPKGYSNRGNVRQQQGDFSGALEDFNTAIQLDPSSETVYYNRGNLYFHNGESALAEADYGQAIRLNPSYANTYTNRGILRQRTNKFTSAIRDFEKALEVAPPDWPNPGSVEEYLKTIKDSAGL